MIIILKRMLFIYLKIVKMKRKKKIKKKKKL